jgi:hypothetical protein
MNIKLAKFTKISLLGWKEYKVGQIYNFFIGYFELFYFGPFMILSFLGLFFILGF